MRQKSVSTADTPEKVVRDIRRATHIVFGRSVLDYLDRPIFVPHHRLSGFAEHSTLVARRGSLVNRSARVRTDVEVVDLRIQEVERSAGSTPHSRLSRPATQ